MMGEGGQGISATAAAAETAATSEEGAISAGNRSGIGSREEDDSAEDADLYVLLSHTSLSSSATAAGASSSSHFLPEFLPAGVEGGRGGASSGIDAGDSPATIDGEGEREADEAPLETGGGGGKTEFAGMGGTHGAGQRGGGGAGRLQPGQKVSSASPFLVAASSFSTIGETGSAVARPPPISLPISRF